MRIKININEKEKKMKKNIQKALYSALETVDVPTEEARRDAMKRFQKKEGSMSKKLEAALSQLTYKISLRRKARRVFWARLILKKLTATLAIAAIVVGSGVMMKGLVNSPQVANTEPEPYSAESSTKETAVKYENINAINAFIPILKAVNWGPEMINLDGSVDPSLDKSKTGSSPFLKDGFKSIDEALAFAQSNDMGAVGARLLAIQYTGCTEEEYMSKANWITCQPVVDFVYKEMTMLKNGRIKTSAEHKGYSGEIFVAFIAPRSQKYVVIRAGCANPTLFVPQPVTPEPEETTRPLETTTVPRTPTTTIPGTTKEKTTETKATVPQKNPKLDVNVNPYVAAWKKDGDDRHSVSMDPSKSNGIQVDPLADQLKAEADAAVKAANDKLAHWIAQQEAESSGAGVVDNNQTNVEVTTGQTDPNWSPFG